MPNYDFSYDPVTAISEDKAKGKTAEIFLDIRKTMHIPFITSIWRGLASIENSLEDIWSISKPIYLTGTPELALNNMINSINLPKPPAINMKAFNHKDLHTIKEIIKVYNRSNGMNLMALSALIKSEYKPRLSISIISPKEINANFPKLLDKDDISNTNWKCVKIVNSLGAPNGVSSHVATLWRHLSYWPNFLNEVIHSFEKISMNGDIINTQNEVLNYVNNNGINLKRQKFKYTYINNLALETIRDYVNTNNQVIRMVVLGNIMKKWLEN
jgi:hypothetical protein